MLADACRFRFQAQSSGEPAFKGSLSSLVTIVDYKGFRV